MCRNFVESSNSVRIQSTAFNGAVPDEAIMWQALVDPKHHLASYQLSVDDWPPSNHGVSCPVCTA